ncbi:MAG: hypothetical protein ACC645_17290 [Pirellulales bacterium]
MRSSGIARLVREPCRNSAELVPAYEYAAAVKRKTIPFLHPTLGDARQEQGPHHTPAAPPSSRISLTHEASS